MTASKPDQLTIGAFARESRLTVKALRHYDRLRILCPSWTDPDTGYRYYTRSQLRMAEQAKVLRGLEMPLAEVKAVLGTRDREVVRRLLDRYRREVEGRLEEGRQILLSLQEMIDGAGEAPVIDAAIRQIPECVAFCVQLEGKLETAGRDIGLGFTQLYSRLGSEGLRPSGAAFLCHPEASFRVPQAFRLCVPLGVPAQQARALGAEVLPGGHFAAATHIGDYARLPETWVQLERWCDAASHPRGGEFRAVYRVSLVEARDPRELRTDVLCRVEHPA